MVTRMRPSSRRSWIASDRPTARIIGRPLREFLKAEVAGGIVLLGATVVALVWANVGPGETYQRLWTTTFTLRLGSLELSEDLRHWVNDGLMAIFFFVVGLEIKRELVRGELREPRKAVLPAIAALGGMVLPAAVYLALNAGRESARGWGIPMATDIAFALGVLALLGPRVPSSLKVFLLSVAIVDDIGAIVVIALFYSGGIDALPLGIALALLVIIMVLKRMRVWWIPVYVVLGTAVWLAVFESGVHATIAGVASGCWRPCTPWTRPARDIPASSTRRVTTTIPQGPGRSGPGNSTKRRPISTPLSRWRSAWSTRCTRGPAT
jgi:NhaA family Na+:H+ antiporter